MKGSTQAGKNRLLTPLRQDDVFKGRRDPGGDMQVTQNEYQNNFQDGAADFVER